MPADRVGAAVVGDLEHIDRLQGEPAGDVALGVRAQRIEKLPASSRATTARSFGLPSSRSPGLCPAATAPRSAGRRP